MHAVLMHAREPATEVEVAPGWRALANVIESEGIEVVRPRAFGARDINEGYPVLVVDDEGARNGSDINVGASLIYGGPIYGEALVLGEALVDGGEDGFEPDLVGLDKVPGRSAKGWLEYINHLVQHLARDHGKDV